MGRPAQQQKSPQGGESQPNQQGQAEQISGQEADGKPRLVKTVWAAEERTSL